MPKRLLVVDDEEMNRDLLSRMLLRAGFEVVTAAGGPQTLEILASQPVDLVLLDVTMPGMSGLDVLERIRRHSSAAALPVIMVTALPESDGLVTAMRMGANDYIAKPIDYAVALARIEARLSPEPGRPGGQAIAANPPQSIDRTTLLPNLEWLESELEQRPAVPEASALLLLELDEFDRYLSQEGSRRMLQAVAARLVESLRLPGPDGPAELASGREGQFAVLLRPAAGPESVERLAVRLQAALRTPLAVDGENAFVSASVGISLAPAGRRRDTLLRDAQAALRHARAQGNGRISWFQEAMRRREMEELRLAADMRRAVERQEFVVHYQPKVALETGAIEGFEALVRWNLPGRGLVMPNQFIPMAERSGLIVPIGEFVLRRACLQTAHLRRSFPRVSVSVNVSGRQFSGSDLVEQVRLALDAASLEPAALRLEVTETTLLGDAAGSVSTMRRLRQIGVGLKLDDFGTGYSSFAYLRQFPFDTLKIDRSFVMGMDGNPEGVALVRAMLELARSLHMNVVAEGIETRRQAHLLRGMGCRYGQGYWFSRPVELPRLRELLAGRKLPAGTAPPRPAVTPEVLAYE